LNPQPVRPSPSYCKIGRRTVCIEWRLRGGNSRQ
jgi:hypothetical protein